MGCVFFFIWEGREGKGREGKGNVYNVCVCIIMCMYYYVCVFSVFTV